jgi:hypothetical protein
MLEVLLAVMPLIRYNEKLQNCHVTPQRWFINRKLLGKKAEKQLELGIICCAMWSPSALFSSLQQNKEQLVQLEIFETK